MVTKRVLVYTPAIRRKAGDYLLSDDPDLLQEEVIHHYLSQESYWAKGVPLVTVQQMIAGSVCMGLYHGDNQAGFARVITDQVTFAYLADVFVLPSHQGKGLGKALVAALQEHPVLQGLRRWLLVTYDAHSLYTSFGFEPLERPETFMTRHNPAIYQQEGRPESAP